MNNYDALYQAHWPDCYRRHLLGLADATPAPAHPVKLPHHGPAPKMGRPAKPDDESDHDYIARNHERKGQMSTPRIDWRSATEAEKNACFAERVAGLIKLHGLRQTVVYGQECANLYTVTP